jgi:hypothetical protein
MEGGAVSKGIHGLIVAAAAIAALVGCGSGGGEEQLTKAQFVKRGNAICAKAEQERGKIISEIVEKSRPNADVQAQQEKVIHEALPTYEAATEQIDDLEAPSGDEEKVDALVEAMEEAAERAMADPHTAIISNVPFRKANELAEGYGLKTCVV